MGIELLAYSPLVLLALFQGDSPAPSETRCRGSEWGTSPPSGTKEGLTFVRPIEEKEFVMDSAESRSAEMIAWIDPSETFEMNLRPG